MSGDICVSLSKKQKREGDETQKLFVNFAGVDQTRSVEAELSEARCCSGFSIQMFLVMHQQSHFNTGNLALTCFHAWRTHLSCRPGGPPSTPDDITVTGCGGLLFKSPGKLTALPEPNNKARREHCALLFS